MDEKSYCFAKILPQSAEQLEEDAPDVVDGGELYALAGGVGLHDAGAYAGYLYAGVVLDEEAGLEDEVHGDHAGPPAEDVVEGVAGELEEGRVLVFLPCGCGHDDLAGAAVLAEGVGYVAAQRCHVGVDEASRVRGYKEVVGLGGDASHVVGRLYGAGHVVAHLDNALGCEFQTGEQCLDGGGGQDGVHAFALLDGAGQMRVVGVFLAQPFVDHGFLSLDVFGGFAGGYADDDFC